MEIRSRTHSAYKKIICRLRKSNIYLPLFYLILLALDLVFRNVQNLSALTPVNDRIPMLFTLSWCLLLTAVVLLLPAKAARVYIPLVTTVFAVLMVVHCGMFSFNGKYFSFSDIRFAADGAAFFSFDYIFIRKIIIATAVGSILASLVLSTLVPCRKYTTRYVLLPFLLAAASLVGIYAARAEVNLQDAFLSWDNYKRKNALYENFTDTEECIMLTGLYQYTFRDFCLSYNIYDRIGGASGKRAALDDYYESKAVDSDNGMTDLFEGKNLILIQLEAIDTWMINEVCMPTLTALKQDSLDCVNHYAPMYLAAGTFNTENIVNTGLVSPFVGGSNAIYTRNNYPLSLPNLFRAKGYTANSFHNSRGEVYDRATTHLNWGYQTYFSGTDLGMPDIDFDTNFMCGYDKIVPTDEPFVSFIITYSGHGAYEGSSVSAAYCDKFAALLPENTDEMVIHAYAHAYETDLFIKALVEQLDADGRLDDTVLAFYSDHYNYYVLDDTIVMDQKGVYDQNLIQSTAFFIYSKGLSAEQVTKVTSTIDILPTLVNLFGLDTDGRYYVGNDVFSENGGYVIFKDYSWFDGTVYSKAVAENFDTDYIQNMNEEVSQRLNNSWDTVNLDYFAISNNFVQSLP